MQMFRGENLMPVCLDPNFYGENRTVRTNLLRGKPSQALHEQPEKSVTIGLINNMPDGALEATERQFISLLESASEDMQIKLSFHTLSNIPRNELGALHVKNFYSNVENLSDKKLDGLIVTGREPLTPNLKDEPYWQDFVKILEWAKDNTYSTVWSCLAAHAALLHMDGIIRIKSKHKHCGVFECVKRSDHPLMKDSPASFRLPHSRWNGVSEDALISHGYKVLTQSPHIGADTFVKEDKSLFVFFQGHPEYESNTLLLEYRRDIGRYLRGETNTYPLMPQGYFDDSTVIALAALQAEVKSQSREDFLAKSSTILGNSNLEDNWHSTAACIYRNWLGYVYDQKQRRLHDIDAFMPSHGVDDLAPILAATGAASASDQRRKTRLTV
jgi:homoserine O-succinyltransferase/O-acetyltransferase